MSGVEGVDSGRPTDEGCEQRKRVRRAGWTIAGVQSENESKR